MVQGSAVHVPSFALPLALHKVIGEEAQIRLFCGGPEGLVLELLVDMLTLKLFLLAATSARQVSELHALCIKPPFLLENPLSFVLALNTAFFPKTATKFVLSLVIELSVYYPVLWSGAFI